MTDHARPDGERHALLFGTFDVANYGDLLFPFVARHRLARLGLGVTPVSPTMQRVPFADALQPRTIAAVADGAGAEAVLIGGGEIAHGAPAHFLAEYAIGDLPQWAYPSLWCGASLIGALADKPIIWNAPGAPGPFPEPMRRTILGAVLDAADYVAVRDETSRRHVGGVATVVPDTIAELPTVWSPSMLGEVFRTLCARKEIPADTALLAVHVRPSGVGPEGMAALGAALDAFAAARGLTPLLIAIGASLGDREAIEELSAVLKGPHICLDDPHTLTEIAAAIAHAKGYVGNSMHGYITALAYGRAGVIVARPAFRKFAGFTAHAGRPGDVAAGWDAALARLAATLGEAVAVPASVGEALDLHWRRVAAAIADPDAGRTRRATLLRAYLANGLVGGGMGWLLAPLGLRQGRLA